MVKRITPSAEVNDAGQLVAIFEEETHDGEYVAYSEYAELEDRKERYKAEFESCAKSAGWSPEDIAHKVKQIDG